MRGSVHVCLRLKSESKLKVTIFSIYHKGPGVKFRFSGLAASIFTCLDIFFPSIK